MKKSGAWYTYEGEQLGQGREKAKEFLVDNPELMVEITDKVMRKAGIGEEAAEWRLERARGGRRRAVSRAVHPGLVRSQGLGMGPVNATGPFPQGLLCSNRPM